MRIAPEARRLAAVAAAGLAFVGAVVLASVAIRHGADQLGTTTLSLLRGAHRSAASLEVIAMLAAGWLAWRLRGVDRSLAAVAALIAGISIFLSVLGILAGRNPPPAAAAANLLGGLALAAAFAWLLGRSAFRVHGAGTLPAFPLWLFALQCILGAWISVFSRELLSFVLIAHVLVGIGLAAAVARFARRRTGSLRNVLLGAAIAAPAAGFAAAFLDRALAPSVAHAGAAALLVAAAAYVRGRFA